MSGARESEDARLRRLLGGPGLAALRRRLRARYERGETRDEFTLGALGDEERRALEGLLGRPVRSARSMRVKQSELDASLARAGLASDLRSALEALDGPLVNRKHERAERDRRWLEVLGAAAEPRLAACLGDAASVTLLRRLAAGDPEQGRVLLERAALVLECLPAYGVPLARLAAETLGDAHALDAGQPVAALVLRAGAAESALGGAADAAEDAEAPSRAGAARRRDRWAELGVSVNDLAAPVLCLNLAAAAETPAGALAAKAAELGVPVHLSLRSLLRHPPEWRVSGRRVYVCENSAVIAIAADRLGARSPPLICTDGMPGAAQQALLRQVAARGARLLYHGDFDWPGLAIGNFVMRSFAAVAWRFGAADYRAAASGLERELSGRRVEASWDPALAEALAQRGTAVHEEAVVETLLADFAVAAE